MKVFKKLFCKEIDRSILQNFCHCSARLSTERTGCQKLLAHLTFSKSLRGSRTRGFTLIELLVVISIIGLLSSIVLASLVTARNKAKVSAFRQEIMQFVNAIELFKSQYGFYPHLMEPGDTDYFYLSTTYDFETTTQGDPNAFKSMLSGFITKLPIPPNINSAQVFFYRVNSTSSTFKCMGDISTPPYIIHINNAVGFDDWPGLEGAPSDKCFSLK